MRGIAATVVAVVFTVAAGVGALAAAGGASLSPASGTPTGVDAPGRGHLVGLCGSLGAVEAGAVTRSSGFPANSFSSPPRITMASPGRARQALRLLCGLPLMPAGLHCPADFAVDYSFRFAAGSGRSAAVGVQPTGCEAVTGLGRPRWMATAPASFWGDLGTALGLAHASRATFTGSMPG